uniref:contactin-2-like n=1 Tax=Myxine glutinosa TaxID=7769 RepID=UPI00358F18AB
MDEGPDSPQGTQLAVMKRNMGMLRAVSSLRLPGLQFFTVFAILFGTALSTSGEGTAGPVFIQQPADTLFPEESAVTKLMLRCRALANPPATYSWLLNDIEIDISKAHSLVGGDLVIEGVNKERDSGMYQCLAKNPIGIAMSHKASLQFVHLEPFPSETRNTVKVKKNQGVFLLCDYPAHFPGLYYQWFLNDLPNLIPTDHRRFISQTTGNLYIARVEPEDAGYYSCLVHSSSTERRFEKKSVNSVVTQLIIREGRSMGRFSPSMRVKLPSVTTVLAGDTVSLECFALGNPVPRISWQRLNRGLPGKARRSAAGAILEIPNAQRSDEGTYSCRASSRQGNVTSESELVVEARPEWRKEISLREVDVNSQLVWICEAWAQPAPTYEWLKNGELLLSVNGSSMAGSSSLEIENVTLSDSGMYQCVARNKHGEILSNAELRVLSLPPEFNVQLTRRAVQAVRGGVAQMPCSPRAAPRPIISWSRGTELLHGNDKMTVLEDGILIIRDLTRTDGGNYTCFAENVLGKANETFLLQIREPTKITLQPSNSNVIVGKTTILRCHASRDPSLDLGFLWLFHGRPIDLEEESDHYGRIEGEENAGDLEIRDAQLAHAGVYTCVARTIVDNTSATAKLIVRGPPGPPGGVMVENVTATTSTITWSRGSNNHSPITCYNIQVRTPHLADGEWMTVKTDPQVIEGNVERAVVLELRPWLQYKFRVTATNIQGQGEPSQPSRPIWTQGAAPIVAPSGVGGGGGVQRELTITWKPMAREYHYGELFGYMVAFRPNGLAAWTTAMVLNAGTTRYVHHNASSEPYVFFEVKVLAFNRHGEGPYSQIALIHSAEDEPDIAPSGIEGHSLSAFEIFVSWERVWLNSTLRRVAGYEVRYWIEKEDEASADRVRTHDGVSSITLKGLKDDTIYKVEVRAYNTGGSGPPSAACNITTRKAPPSQVPELSLLDRSSSELTIEWSPVRPQHNESAVTQYKVVLWKQGEEQGQPQILSGDKTMVSLPVESPASYVVMVKALSDGGEGPGGVLEITGLSGRASSLEPQCWAVLFLASLAFLPGTSRSS